MNAVTAIKRTAARRCCAICQERIPSSEGCTCTKIRCDGQLTARFRFGEEEYDGGRRRCACCGVERGGHHHAHCEKEICPLCGEPLLICGCDVEFIMPG